MMQKYILVISLLSVFVGMVHGEEKVKNPLNCDVVPTSAQDIKPILIGSAVPEIKLTTAGGATLDLKLALTKQPTVLIFYRGGWCPYCNAQLGQLQRVESQLRQSGFQILAVSPDRPEELSKNIEKGKLSYTLLTDADIKAAQAFGIAYRVDEKTLAKYKGYGIDLEIASGKSHHMLPVPSVFIIGRDGRIGFTYVNPDYRVRIDPDVLLAAAKAVMKIEPQK